MIVPSKFTAILIEKQQVTPHVYACTFQLQDGELHISAGQYATIIIDPQTRRQYSFATLSTDPKRFQIIVDVTPMGPGSKFFLEKKVGDAIELLAPLGMFHLEPTTLPIVFVATGTGIAPFRTMMEEYLMHDGKEEMHLYWGLRFEEDVFWKDVFDGWVAKYPNFHYSIVLSKATDTWMGKTGHVTEHMEREITHPETYIFYLCGDRHMIQDVKTDLLAHTVPEGQIKTEPF